MYSSKAELFDQPPTPTAHQHRLVPNPSIGCFVAPRSSAAAAVSALAPTAPMSTAIVVAATAGTPSNNIIGRVPAGSTLLRDPRMGGWGGCQLGERLCSQLW